MNLFIIGIEMRRMVNGDLLFPFFFTYVVKFADDIAIFLKISDEHDVANYFSQVLENVTKWCGDFSRNCSSNMMTKPAIHL